MKKKMLLVAVSVLSVVGCSKKDKSSDSETTNTTASAANTVGNLDISTDPLAKLQLSSSLSPKIPDSVKGSGSGVTPGSIAAGALTARTKSREACNIRQKIREAKMNQESVAMDLCFIESQRGMKAGGKYKMKFSGPGSALTQAPDPDATQTPDPDATQTPDPDATQTPMPGGDTSGGGDPSQPPGGGEAMEFSVFLDNSDKDNFKVFMCDGEKLTQKIVLGGATEKGSKGSYKVKFSENDFSVALTGSFDNGVAKAGRSSTTSQMAFKMGKSFMRSSMVLDIVSDGISVVQVANESAFSEGDFSAADKEIGVALIGPNIGSALFQRTFEGSGSYFGGSDPVVPPLDMSLTLEKQVETSRTFFDNAGQTLAKADSDSFSDTGKLHVKESMFPKLLPDNFSVDFEAGDWDCKGTVDFTVDEKSTEFEACSTKFAASFSDETCDSYAIGIQEKDIGSVVDERGELMIPEFDPNL